ncbi:unnamed protein product [Brachionus calyciflorus]|uniref:Uncharacterized protein n=1 Tax=Brachionus calyciflorus TaxID=104777 RepID=A0A814FQW7_9BILA|nr:unnamed protein product [Brachionus calyciflorus]
MKDSKKSNKDLGNKRPVAISDAFSYIFEAVLLDGIEATYIENKEQFGLKKNLHPSKGFDQVIRTNLWVKLIDKGIHPAIIIATINYYYQSFMLIQNGTEYSDLFKTTLGVLQGAIILSKLFSIYKDDLITQIKTIYS